MKKLICRWFNLVPKEDLLSSQQKVLERDKFIIRLSKDLNPEKCKVLYGGEYLNNTWFEGTTYVLGNYISIIGCNLGEIIIAPGCEKLFFTGITHIESPITLHSSTSISGNNLHQECM